MSSEITWKIGGEAGFGIMVSGLNFARTMVRGGLHVFGSNEYPSLIRGGHNTETVRVSREPISSLVKPVNILVALNKETVDLHKDELIANAAVIYDPSGYELSPSDFSKPVQLLGIPLLELAKAQGGDVLMRNTVAIGASLALMGFDLAIFTGVLEDQFKRKGETIVTQNVAAATSGYNFIQKNPTTDFSFTLANISGQPKRITITGADAIALGAVAAGMKFFAAYPMTPINTLLHYLASIQEKAGFIYKQPEDEIAAINMAIGASFAGVRSMVATSGGGFSLMVEGTSLAGMTETPVVIVYGMRPGPATGLPTWTGQADLKFILNAGHGEFPRLVLAPGDPLEAFAMTMHAFNLADIYQSPTFIVVDKYLNESRVSIDPNELNDLAKTIPIDRGKLVSEKEQGQTPEFKRYELTEDGISRRPILGRKVGVFRVNSDEHDELGYSTEEADYTKKMVDKRNQKLETARREALPPQVFGQNNADITLVGWGSTKGVAIDALKMFEAKNTGKKINYVHLSWINPFDRDGVVDVLMKAKRIIAIECAYHTPLTDYIHEQTDIKIQDVIKKYDGRQLFVEDIFEGVTNYV